MKYGFLLTLVLVTQFVYGQTELRPVLCGNEFFDNIVAERYPSLRKAFDLTFQQAKSSSLNRSNETLNIQVVVHVVWKEEAENLSDALIHEQIQILNEDYNRLNPDTSNLRGIFMDEAGAANIHFELVEIVRVQTDKLFLIDLLTGNLLTEAKYDDEGGSDAWDPDAYLNIWMLNIQPIEILGIPIGQILGFAFPPNGLDHWPDGASAPVAEEDGVVLDYRIVGRSNPNAIENPLTGDQLLVKGRTATHEVGHYLGLRHIWGDGNELGPNDCQQSDGMDDTPFADSQSSFDCDISKNSCQQVEAHYSQDMPDLIENFMDYASDACMNMFTNHQVDLMRNVLLGPRSGLIENVSSTVHPQEIAGFYVTPNPARDLFEIGFQTGRTTPVEATVTDINGHLLLQSFEKYLTGQHKIKMNVSGLESGIYFVRLRTETGIAIQKLIIP